jgi:rRNA maturation protein Nop10
MRHQYSRSTQSGTRGLCNHETCPECRRIVVPVVRESRLFITEYCPNCGSVISDVAKPQAFSACVLRRE